jgi:hypothetical protein
MRDRVLSHIEGMKLANPGISVVDVGGGANPWCDKYVDAYIDIKPFKTKKRLILGDINSEDVWAQIPPKSFDFSICTHTLEDIRNPDFVLKKLMAVSKSGFVAVPNKHTEMSAVESVYWVGYCHHRWVFTISDRDTLRLLPKLPLTGYFSPSNYLAHLISKLDSKILSRAFLQFKRGPALPSIEWIQRGKVKSGFELGFIWKDDFDFEFVNGDYPGDNVFEAARLYTGELRKGI